VYNFGDIRSRNPRVYAVNSSTFCGDTTKISISRHISQNVLDILDILYMFGRRIGGDDYPSIHLALLKGLCYGNQLNWEDVRRHRQERSSLRRSTMD